MNIRDISPVTTVMYSLSNQTNKHPPASQAVPHNGKLKPDNPTEDNTITERPVTPQKPQRVQPLKKPPPINAEPVNLKAGVIKTFAHEIDLVKKQIMTPESDKYERLSLDSLA